jgi:hypothetical protein
MRVCLGDDRQYSGWQAGCAFGQELLNQDNQDNKDAGPAGRANAKLSVGNLVNGLQVIPRPGPF